MLVELLVAEPVAIDSEQDAEHVTEVVVDDGRAGTRRELALRVPHLATQLVPDLRQHRAVVLVLDLDREDREARLGRRADLLELAELLHGLLHGLADLFGHLGRCRARVARDHLGFLDRELRVFESAQRLVGSHAPEDEHHDKDPHGGPVLQCECGKSHGVPSSPGLRRGGGSSSLPGSCARLR